MKKINIKFIAIGLLMLIGCMKGKEESCRCGKIMNHYFSYYDPDRNWELVIAIQNNCSGNLKYVEKKSLKNKYTGDYVCFSKSW